MKWWVRTGLYSLVYTLLVVAGGVFVLTQNPSPTEAGDDARAELLGMLMSWNRGLLDDWMRAPS